MIYLSGSGSGELVAAAAAGVPVGLLCQPVNGEWSRVGLFRHWAADNGCFAGGAAFDQGAWLHWLAGTTHRERCLFAVAPDVLGDAAATWARSAPLLPVLRDLGFKAALVAQDGFDAGGVDWAAFDCLFVGGTDAYKLSEAAYRLVGAAQARGKWCHMGRVNSLRRLRAAHVAGYDSADGTHVRFRPDAYSAEVVRWLAQLDRQACFPV